jgi:hypothetical protein
VDGVTGVSLAFTGNDTGIYSGTYDPKARTIVWANSSETWKQVPKPGWRVMSFTTCENRFYATVGASIYQRQDGPTPSWNTVYTASFPPGADINATGGLRGIYCAAKASGGHTLLVAKQGVSSVLNVDQDSAFEASVEQDVNALATRELGTMVNGVLFAYNEFTPATDPVTQEPVLLAGYEAHLPNSVPASIPVWTSSGSGFYAARAHYLVRRADASYAAYEMEDPTLDSPPPRVSVRTMALSPFAADRGTVVYAGGFDCNGTPEHNTAWVLKGPVGTALGH